MYFLVAGFAIGLSSGVAHCQKHLPTVEKTPLRLERLLRTIHRDILAQKSRIQWLSGYSGQCLETNPSMIIYIPSVAREWGDGPQPQQPDQMELLFVPLQANARMGFKYSKLLDDLPETRFPQFGLKLNANVVDWGPDRYQIISLIRQIAQKECRRAHASIRQG